MIAASCGVKKKDVEASNSGNQDPKTNSESNSGNQDPKTNSESNSGNQDPKTNSESNSGNQDPKTNGSSNESTRPSQGTQNDMPTENSEIDGYLDKVKKYGKEASEFANLLATLITLPEGTEEANKLLKKYAKFELIVKKFFNLYESLDSNFEKTKKEIEEVIGNPERKNGLLDILKRYKESRTEIKTAIEELKDLIMKKK